MSQPVLLTKLFVVSLLILGCSSSDKIDTNTAEGAYKLAQKYEKDERYEEAITYYSEVKNKYPYSNFATESELRIADIEFVRENYVEAETAYKLFKEFHPTHLQSDYVTFRLGLSVFHQLPATIDRDLALAQVAIDHFSSVINSYSKSKYVAEATQYRTKSQQMLADKAHYIAEFYFIREKWESSLGRYEELIKNFPGRGYEARALYGATLSAYKFKDLDKAKSYFKQLLAEHPDSAELARARNELSDGF